MAPRADSTRDVVVRRLRLKIGALAAGLAVGALAPMIVDLFDTNEIITAADIDPAVQLELVVAEREALGLRCRTEPTLTDVVLFVFTGDPEIAPVVRVLTFDEALAAASAESGWILRYCS